MVRIGPNSSTKPCMKMGYTYQFKRWKISEITRSNLRFTTDPPKIKWHSNVEKNKKKKGKSNIRQNVIVVEFLK